MSDEAIVQEWLRGRPGYESAAVAWMAPVEGGVSNLTYRVALRDAPLRSVALRVQRARGIFEPYDILREGRVVERLAASEIPVPAMVGAEPDETVLGAPFIVMEWVDAPHMGEAGPEASFGAFTAMVARIHGADWRGLGLEFLGPPASAQEGVLQDLATWEARMKRFPGAENEILADALARLRAAAPDDGELALCHGDINIFNYLFRERRVAAVIDWEQARIGDLRYDIGQLVALSHLRGAPFGPVHDQGFVQAYEMATMRELRGVEYFRALWLFQLGVIYFGWMAFNDSEPWYRWEGLIHLLEDALQEI